MEKKIIQQKNLQRNFFLAKIYLSICPNTYEFFQILFFWKPRLSKNVLVVFANRFDRLSRNFLNVVRSHFAYTYPNFVTFDRFLKTKEKKNFED